MASRKQDYGPARQPTRRYRSTTEWWRLGLQHPWGIAVALTCAWLPLYLAVLAAGVGAVIGGGAVIVASVYVAFPQLPLFGSAPVPSAIVGSLNVFAILGGISAGAAAGFGFIVWTLLLSHPGTVITLLLEGLLVTAGITALTARFEPLALRIRGYRHLSWEEWERVWPLMECLAELMGIDEQALPRILVSDQSKSQAHAWTHLRTIIVTRALLDPHGFDDNELGGVLAHELYHWRSGHIVAIRFIWAAALPLVIMLNLLYAVNQLSRLVRGAGVLSLAAWLVFWPMWVVMHGIVIPAQAGWMRQAEYEADAGAMAAGDAYRDGFRAVLLKTAALEQGRTGWEKAITATHPPTALRVERLISLAEAQRRADILAHHGGQKAPP